MELVAAPGALGAHIVRARYQGGEATGALRIEGLAGPHGKAQPMTLTVEGRGVSVERFFGDIHLPGTGISGTLALSVALHWDEGGIERASGGGSITIEPGPPRPS